MTDVPRAVTSALAHRAATRPPERHGVGSSARVREGDLRVIMPHFASSTDRRIGMVLRVDSANEFCEVLLVHTAPELATDRDVILASIVASAPYDVVVQTDLRGAVWTLQLGERVGDLPEQALAAVKATGIDNLADGPSKSLAIRFDGLHTGTPLAGPIDGRWSYKEAEGVALRALAADCTEALLDRGVGWEMNPDLLRRELFDSADDPERFQIELVHWARTRYLYLNPVDLEALQDAGALEPSSWSQHSDLGADMLMALGEVLTRSATGVRSLASTEGRWHLTAPHLGLSDGEVLHDRVHYIAGKEPVA